MTDQIKETTTDEEIVATVRDNGRVRQKVIANLGRRDTLEAILPALNRFLTGQDPMGELGDGPKPIAALDASTWGPTLVVRALFEQLGLWDILDDCDCHRPPHLRGDDDRGMVGATAMMSIALRSNVSASPTYPPGGPGSGYSSSTTSSYPSLFTSPASLTATPNQSPTESP